MEKTVADLPWDDEDWLKGDKSCWGGDSVEAFLRDKLTESNRNLTCRKNYIIVKRFEGILSQFGHEKGENKFYSKFRVRSLKNTDGKISLNTGRIGNGTLITQ